MSHTSSTMCQVSYYVRSMPVYHGLIMTTNHHQVAGLAHKKNLKIEKLTNIFTSETILEPSQSSMADHSCRNSQRLKVINYFLKETLPQIRP